MVRELLTAKKLKHLLRIPIVALLLVVAACEAAKDAIGDSQSSTDSNWKLVQAYIELDTAWHAKQAEIYSADEPAEERDRRLKEELGGHPDIVLAVGAAKAIIEAEGERVLDAARFLVEHPRGLSPTEAQDIELGLATLRSVVGPDWSVVEDFMALSEEHEKKHQEIYDSDLSDDEKSKASADLGRGPKGTLARVAAIAIAELGTEHEKSREAAEFLIRPGASAPEPESAIKGAIALRDNFPEYDNWGNALAWLDFMRSWDSSGVVKEFISDMAENSPDPQNRAMARYFAGTALMNDLNGSTIEADRRDELRAEALEYVTGFSLGIEDNIFELNVSEDSELEQFTFAEKEELLIHGIRHATVGGTVLDEPGRRLDGSEESLSAYSEKVILVDFWATWCGPCVGALPELRELASSYPKERFEILAISVDDEVETVLEFMEDEPMPWAQWHVGSESEIARTWQIRAFPTYVVIDENGVILGRSSNLTETSKLIEQELGPPERETPTES